MRDRGPLWMLAAIGVAVFIAAVAAGRWPDEKRRHEREMNVLRIRQGMLRDSLKVLLARDALMKFARDDSSEVTLALSEPLVTRLIQDIAVRYLDRIELDLELDLEEHKEGDLRVPTPFGRITAGDWKVQATIQRITGTLAAQRPVATLTGSNRIHLEIPAEVKQGNGTALLDFTWNSKSAFNILCRDFRAAETVHGTILPQEHVVRGDLVLSAGEDGIIADPDFPREKYPLSMTLTDESWGRVREALAKQDKVLKCGLVMNPDSVVARLRALGFRGIKVRLPRKVFRTVVLPATLTRSVRILKKPVELSVAPNALRISPGLFWYSAEVETRPASPLGPLLPWPAAAK